MTMSLSGIALETKDAANDLLQSVGAALERQLGPAARVYVLGFLDSAAAMRVKSADGTRALYINVLITTPDANVDAVVNLQGNSAALQEDLQAQGT